MILIDTNMLLLSAMLPQIKPTQKFEEDFHKHIMINYIRSHVKKFKEYGEVVLCCDSRNYWRKSVFPHYKSHRKGMREKSPLDWNLIFKVINETKQDLKDYFPYKVVEVDDAEADDIIGTLTPRFAPTESVLIVSSDADFKQLHKYNNVKQYNPMLGVYVKSPNPAKELKEKIIRGDKGDNIPNILTDVNDFVSGKRQTSISTKKLNEWLDQDPQLCFDSVTYERFQKNQQLIDFDYIPEDIRERIISEYERCQPNTKQTLYKYLVSKKMITLLECIEDF